MGGMVTFPLDSLLMAKSQQPKKEPTRQLNVLVRVTTIKRMMRFGNDHPLQPSLARIVEAAVTRYLDEEEPKLSPRKD